MTRLFGYRLLCGVLLSSVTLLGVGKTVYGGWGQAWLAHLSGDVMYALAWIWFVGAWQVRWPACKIAIAIFFCISLLECSQRLPIPEAWRTLVWWQLLISSGFAWQDFLYYGLGCLFGGFSLSWLRAQFGIGQRPASLAKKR